MSPQAPKVSIVIAAYSPGDAVRRVIDSLDAQTLPQDEFEVIFVDDGSPDDTFDRLDRIAASRSNMSVYQIQNSGWPSRPRNVGIGYARGEYLLFMDHDDSLYPDGLRRAYEYARENDADVLSPKESKTDDVWWGMSSLTEGNLPNVLADAGIERMLPMVPHKLYRRQMFLDHGIRFPDGPRVLWEDWFINLDAYRHSKIVSVLADSPVYLWHASDTNTSHTFDPAREDFWDRLDDMMAYIDTVLAGPDFHREHVTVMTHQVRSRVIGRCLQLVSKADAINLRVRRRAMIRARALLNRYATDEVVAHLPKKHQAQLHLMLADEMDLMKAFHEADLGLKAHTAIGAAHWDDGVLHYDAETWWEPKNPDVPGFRVDNDRVLRAVTADLERVIPPELLDLTDDARDLVVETSIRGRAEYVTWATPFDAEPARFIENADGALSLVQLGHGRVELDRAALGRPLEDAVWDIRARTEFVGMERKGALLFDGEVMASIHHGRAAVAYRAVSKGLSIDLAQRLRTLAIDAVPRSGPAGGLEGFSAPLTRIDAFGTSTLAADMVVAIAEETGPETSADALEELAAAGDLHAGIVVDDDGARLEGRAELAQGRYRLYARREGKLHRTRRSIVVHADRTVDFD